MEQGYDYQGQGFSQTDPANALKARLYNSNQGPQLSQTLDGSIPRRTGGLRVKKKNRNPNGDVSRSQSQQALPGNGSAARLAASTGGGPGLGAKSAGVLPAGDGRARPRRELAGAASRRLVAQQASGGGFGGGGGGLGSLPALPPAPQAAASALDPVMSAALLKPSRSHPLVPPGGARGGGGGRGGGGDALIQGAAGRGLLRGGSSSKLATPRPGSGGRKLDPLLGGGGGGGGGSGGASLEGSEEALHDDQSFIASLALTPLQMAEFLQSDGHFLYLQHRRGADPTAYDLEVAPAYERHSEEYYTLSRAGITHFRARASEFTPLDRWEREFKLFHIIRRIPFFRKYTKWKAFASWRRSQKRRKVGAAAGALAQKLFLFAPALRRALLGVRAECVAVGERRLFDLGPGPAEGGGGRTRTLPEFVAAQQEVQKALALQMADFSSRVHALVRVGADEVVDRFLKANGVRADHKMTFMERAALRSECRKLTRFLRLVDLQVVDTLHNLALDSVQEALELVAPRDADNAVFYQEEGGAEAELAAAAARPGYRRPLFATVADFAQDGALRVVPGAQDFTAAVDAALHAALAVVGVPERVLRNEELASYVMADTDDAADEVMREEASVMDVVAADERFDRAAAAVKRHLRDAFAQVQEYVTVFTPYKETYFENSEYIENIYEKYKTADLELYRAEIARYRGQAAEFEGIPREAHVGILRVESAELKRRLMPSPVLCIQALKKLLPELMSEHAKALLDVLADLVPVVTGAPSTVEHFVRKKRVVAECFEALDGYKERAEKVHKMAELMGAQEWALPDQEKVHLVMIDENMTTLENGLEIAQGLEEEETKRFAAQVREEVPQLRRKVVGVREALDSALIADADRAPADVLRFLEEENKRLLAHKDRAEKLQEYQNVLGQKVDEFETLDEVVADMNLKLRLWKGVQEWQVLTQAWVGTPFKDVNSDELEKKVQYFSKLCHQATKGLPGNPVVPRLKSTVDDFVPVLPVVVNLANPALQDRHWQIIHDLIGFEIKGNEAFTLGELIEKQVTNFHEEITHTATSAVQEAVLEEMLAKITNLWASLEFEVKPYKDVKDLYILGDTSDVVAGLDDSLVTINTILGSRYVKGIRGTVDSWRSRLVLFQETLDEWLAVQRNWMYLETIFSSPGIARQLPAPAKLFQGVDLSFKNIMKQTADDPLAIKAGTVKDRVELFRQHNANLDKIQKSLEDYLETKRGLFPRFYFLSNDELLEILSSAKDPQAVQPHLRKCFDNLVRLRFADEPGSIDILAMFSGEGEEVDLGKNLKARGEVEEWLLAVEERMKKRLWELMKEGLKDYDAEPRKDWVVTHKGQIVATVAQMTWARDTERALRDGSMAGWLEQYLADLQDLIVKIRGDLSKLERKTIVALVTTDVHARDIIEQLIQEGVQNPTSFTWQQQLRYYWSADTDDILICHSDAKIQYGYEYMGATSRLVITPLTDRCWLTLTGSYGLKLGAAPAGPAGTGKTESSKDLAKAMGILCVVFNCSDQIDYKMMGKLFRGLAQAGCWTCLDEFNRIDIEVLSVIAQQVLTLKEGRLAGKENIQFMGVQIRLKDHHVIITMNPGYAGRTELPDNLAVLFRPVAMMVPNYALIAEIMLFAEGFGDAKTLSRKMCKLYILCSEQLSQQPHYDYGLRAVKSVLVMAGSLKRANPDLVEDLVLIRALRDSNQPKFLSDDIPLFQAIVQDLFPGTVIPSNDYGELAVALEEELDKAHLQKVPKFMEKVIQMFDIFNIRFGATLVGPTGGGKTTIYQILANTMTNLREKGSANHEFEVVHYEILNPKCITMGELYGEFNPLTQEWHDGLASTLMRRAVGTEGPDKRWTVFDGPIDALWIENMNTVLDDNMTLCLANGERIKLKLEMKMLFEVMDLAVASPATVSRIGVVYITPGDLGWLPYVQTWLATKMPEQLAPALKEHLLALYTTWFGPAMDFVYKKCRQPVESVPVQFATSSSLIVQSLVLAESGFDFALPEEKQRALIDKIFGYSMIWSLGAALDSKDWERFDEWLREFLEAGEAPLKLGLPHSGTVFDFSVDLAAAEFKPWSEQVPEFQYDEQLSYFELMVPTADTVRFSAVARRMITMDKPVFVTGVSGTGKTVLMQKLLQSCEPLPDEGGLGVVPIFINFSAQTASLTTQATVEGKLEKKRKTLLGAPAGRRVTIFVDDVNMPLVEEYGAQAPIELLRQFLDFKGFYDRDKLFWKDVADTLLFAGAAPPGGGRNAVTPRFVRHFNVLCIPPASDAAMALIFSSILRGFLKKFDGEVQKLAGGVVGATIEVYNTISAELLPTPARFHYTFNLRDISKVFQGLLMATPRKCQDPGTMARLWVHEAARVFHDRLINEEDQRWYTELCVELCARQLKMPLTHEELFEGAPVVFCDFLKGPGTEPEDRFYEEAKDMTKVNAVLMDFLDEYNVSFPTTMDLVFFTDAMVHACRVCRVLRQPRGNAMLVGVGGSGKQSLTRVSAYASGYELVQIEISRGYGIPEFREDIKKMMIKAGVEGKDTVFLFTDSQIVCEDMLEDINNVLNSGEIPNLFPQDELDKVISDMFPVAKAKGIPETRDNCYNLFVQRVRELLHVVLCMSPVGDALRVRCRQFPSLINCTTIDWFMKWPESALISVADHFLAHLQLPESVADKEAVKGGIVRLAGHVHQSIAEAGEQFYDELRRRVYTTPKSYLDLINLYMKVLGELQDKLNTKKEQMETGVRKLKETNEMVDGLKDDLNKLAPVLEQKSKDAEVLLAQVEVDQAEAGVIKERVSKEEAEVGVQAAEVQAVQADAQADLDKALPALQSAIRALDSLDKADIVEVKGFAKPPDAVKTVMEAVCIMFGQKPDWDNSKKILADMQFLDKLKTYDKDNIPAATLKKVAKYIADPTMEASAVQRVSKAAGGLALWVHAMDVYSKVAKEVGPKKAKLAEMNRILSEANALLATKQAELQAVTDKVAKLQEQCDQTMAEKKALADESELTASRLERAEKLTGGLEDEGVRWRQTLVDIARDALELLGNTFLAAACVSYYGPFTGIYRRRLVADWLAKAEEFSIPRSAGFELATTLGDPVQIREWQNCRLPADAVSTDSAILVARTSRWPLMIDPQGQANQWIKKLEERAALEVTTMTDPNVLRKLETCIRNGKPLLLEDVGEQLEPALEPVLQRAVFKQGNRQLIRIGDNDVDYDPLFKLYMTSKNPNPHYLPEVCIKVNLINFTVTMDGLTDQLLGEVVKRENAAIEEKKVKLLVRMAEDRKQLALIEATILQQLAESEGNILDNQALIDTLSTSKITSNMIKERVKESQVTQKEIADVRRRYVPVAERGAIIYFVVADLAKIDPMYQYSLNYFRNLFCKCIETSEPSTDLQRRIRTLIDYPTLVIYQNICRGLFEKDKILFSALICFQILKHAGKIGDSEWSLFVRGPGVVDREAQPPNPWPAKLAEPQWDLLSAAEERVVDDGAFATAAGGDEGEGEGEDGAREQEQQEGEKFPQPFAGLGASLKEDQAVWAEWMDGADPMSGALPGQFQHSVNAFQRLILIKAFREDLLLQAVTAFVGRAQGERFAESPAASMAEIYADLDNATPCIFILSTGADPTGMLLRFAKERGKADNMALVSLGQGQGPVAQQLIQDGTVSGEWVLLQNCMLAKSWMGELERIVFELAENRDKNHEAFRLYLTSAPAAYFPVSVLQNGVKMTNEPPKGMRANVSRSYANLIKEEFYEGLEGRKAVEWKKLICGLAFFHANIQERRKFGPLGWNIRYAFDESDLETSVAVLRRFLEEQDEVPWDALRYVTGQINYGGRVTDDWDRRCLMSILGIYIKTDVLGDGYRFSASGTYYAPPVGSLADCLKYFNQLPANDDPEIFGMHENANVTYNRAESLALIGTVLSLQPRSGGGGGGMTSDEIVEQLASSIEAEVPDILDEEEAGPTTFVVQPNGLLTSLAIVLTQEMVKFNRLLRRMASSLADLKKAIKGFIVMSLDLDKMYMSFLNNQVPGLWSAVGFESLKTLGSWVKDTLGRVAFFRKWLREGQPAAFELPVFFFPQGFMTGTLQTFARKYEVAIDTLSFKFEVLDREADTITEAPDDGIIVYGLWMEGARWDADARQMAISRPGEMYTPLPVIHFIPEVDHKQKPTDYACPIYKTAVRKGVLSTTGMSTNFVIAVELPTLVDPDVWVLYGVAGLCLLSD